MICYYYPPPSPNFQMIFEKLVLETLTDATVPSARISVNGEIFYKFSVNTSSFDSPARGPRSKYTCSGGITRVPVRYDIAPKKARSDI